MKKIEKGKYTISKSKGGGGPKNEKIQSLTTNTGFPHSII